jgi:ABC-type sugar transport system ATPase subunit
MDAADMNVVVLELKEISKSFGAVNALTGVNLTVHSGEVVALAGDNGAGKSTLVKIITGVHAPTNGSMKINGKEVHFSSPKEAAIAGVAAVYQDLSLCDNLSAAANLMLGQEPRRRGWRGWLGMIDTGAMHDKARTALTALGIRTLASTETLVSFLSGGQRQAIAIVRASLEEANIIVLDEPTAALGVRERDLVYSLIEKLKASGYGIVLISHSVPEILRLADRVSVLRLGRIATTLVGQEMEGDAIVSAITGSKVVEGEMV